VKLRNDIYRKSRGGYSRLFEIKCASCEEHLFYYQKDGPGILKRLYLDRIYKSKKYEGLEHKFLKDIPLLCCPKCHEHIGVPNIYKKENRVAFRLFSGAIQKKIVKSI